MNDAFDPALLHDLLDGRLPPAEADEVRRRIAADPDLKARFDDLVRLKEAVRNLPVPERPADFVERVRRARDGAGVDASASTPPAPQGARILRWRPWLYAAAAGVGVVAAIGFYSALHPETAVKEARETATSRDATSLPVARDTLETESAAKAMNESHDAGATVASGERPPAFKGPGGSIPSGLRQPSDRPSQPGGTPPEAPPAAAPSGGGSAPSSPPADTGAQPVTPPTPPPTPPGPPPATTAPPTSLGATGGGSGVAARSRPAAGRADPSMPSDAAKDKAPGGRNDVDRESGGLAWAFSGVDDVLVVRSESIDGARSQVALLLSRLREGEVGGYRTKKEAGEKGDVEGKGEGKSAAPREDGLSGVARVSRNAAPKDADQMAETLRRARFERGRAGGETREPDGSGGGGGGAPVAPVAKAEAASSEAIGAFVVTLSPVEARRLDDLLVAATDASLVDREDADAKAPAAKQPSRPSEPAPAPAAEPKPPAERLVRIVVLPAR